MVTNLPQVAIVVPCYNEEPVVDESARQLSACVQRMVDRGRISADSYILFINDGSTDRTWDRIEELCRRDSRFAAIGLSRNFGHQAALLSGLHQAPGDVLVSIDADLQDDPSAIEEMVERFHQGYDIVYGVRRERAVDSIFKRWTASAFYRSMHALGARTLYNHADFRLMSRRAVEALREFREVNLFLRGMVPLIGYRTTTVKYDRSRRFVGETKYPLGKMLGLALSAITSFSNFPLRLITAAAMAGCLVSFLAGLWALWIRLGTDQGVPGWASLLLPTLFIGSLNMLAIGVVGEYVARIFEEVKGRPRYLVSETRNLHQMYSREPVGIHRREHTRPGILE